MGRHELAVEKREPAHLQSRDQPGQRDLRSVGHPAEHAFAEERPSKLHAVEPADQLTVIPDLDRMGMARPVQCEHRALDVVVDPRLVAVRAGSNHRRKVTVHRNREAAGSDCAAQRF